MGPRQPLPGDPARLDPAGRGAGGGARSRGRARAARSRAGPGGGRGAGPPQPEQAPSPITTVRYGAGCLLVVLGGLPDAEPDPVGSALAVGAERQAHLVNDRLTESGPGRASLASHGRRLPRSGRAPSSTAERRVQPQQPRPVRQFVKPASYFSRQSRSMKTLSRHRRPSIEQRARSLDTVGAPLVNCDPWSVLKMPSPSAAPPPAPRRRSCCPSCSTAGQHMSAGPVHDRDTESRSSPGCTLSAHHTCPDGRSSVRAAGTGRRGDRLRVARARLAVDLQANQAHQAPEGAPPPRPRAAGSADCRRTGTGATRRPSAASTPGSPRSVHR